MKKKIMIWLCILSLITALSGCGKEKEKNNGQNSVPVDHSVDVNNSDSVIAEGNYVEHEIIQPDLEAEEYRIGSRVNNLDQFEIFTAKDSEDKTYTTVYKYTLDGDNFVKSEVEWASKASKDLSIMAQEICQSEDGNEYIHFYRIRKEESKNYISDVLVKKTEDEKGYLDITPSYWSEEPSAYDFRDGVAISSLKVSKNEILCYREDGQLELVFYDLKTNKKINDKSNPVLYQFALKENKIYGITDELNEVIIYDLENDETISIALEQTNNYYYNKYIQIGPKNEIIILDKDGMHIQNEGETTWRTIVEGEQNSMTSTSLYAETINVVPGAPTTFFVFYRSFVEGKQDLLVQYKPGTSETSDSTKELKICSLQENPTVREMILAYKKQHPEITITYDVLFSPDTKYSELINTINTELLAGKGADIYVLDYLPVASYIEKGVLMDISDIFTGNGDDLLLKNIMDCYKHGDKIYSMPVRFLIPYYASADDMPNSISSVEDLANYCKDKDKPLVASTTYMDLLSQFFNLFSDEVINEDGSINRDGLASFLSNMKIIADQIEAVPGSIDDAYANMDIHDYYKMMPDSLMWEDGSIGVMYYLNDLSQLEQLTAILQEVDGNYVAINDSFLPSGMIGINQATKEPEISKEFVASLFSESIQSMDLYDGLPVNEKALMNYNIPCRKAGYVAYQPQEGDMQILEFDSLTMDDMKKLTDYAKSVTRPVYQDEDGCKIFYEGGAEYLEGTKTLDEAVDAIIQKYNIYFGE